MLKSEFDFDWAIAPVTRSEFFENVFEKKHLVVKRNQSDYYANLLTIADIDDAVANMGMSVPEITVTKANAGITADDYSYGTGHIDPIRTNQLFADGATIIASGLQERHPRLARYCRALESVFSSRVQTNIYLTPANSQGFKAHYDNHCVVVLQVEGTKEWRFYDTPVALPLNTQGFNPHDVAIGEETARVVLEPGDMLYVPRGMTHDAVATDQTSLHITTGLMVATWADVIAEAVSTIAHNDPAFRGAITPGYANAGFDNSGSEAHFRALLKKLSESSEMMPLLANFKDNFISGRVPRVEGQMANVAKLSGLSVADTVSARPHLVYNITTTEGEDASVTVQCHNSEITLPIFAMEAMEFALSNGPFAISDMPGDLDDDGKLVLVRRMVREGLMLIND